MKQIAVIFICSALLLTLTACQPNPDKPFVQSKNIDRLLEKAGSGETADAGMVREKVDLAARLGVPERYTSQREYPGEKLKLNADAPVILPEYAMPMIRVEPQEFSQELVDNLYDVLIGNTPMYQRPSGVMTKSELEEMIANTKNSIAEIESGDFDNLKRDSISDSEVLQGQKEYLAVLEEAYKTAPESIFTDEFKAGPEIKTHIRPDWLGEKCGEYTGFELTSDRDAGKSFTIMNSGYWLNPDGETVFDSEFGGSRFTYMNFALSSGAVAMKQGGYYTSYSHETEPNQAPQTFIKSIDMVDLLNPDGYEEKENIAGIFSYKEALEVAEELLADAGIDDMMVSTMELFYVLPQSIYDNAQEVYTSNGGTGKFSYWELENDIINGVYDNEIIDIQIIVQLSRTWGGIPITSDSDDYMHDWQGEFYMQPWPYEGFTMSLCKEGILYIEWESPHRIVETIVEDTQMISFDEAVDIFENMYRIKYSGRLQDIVDSAKRVHNIDLSLTHDGVVDRVKLSLRRVTEQNNIELGLLVPVWDFYGVIETKTWEDGVAHHGTNSTLEGYPLMTINAIDGTVIDIMRGY